MCLSRTQRLLVFWPGNKIIEGRFLFVFSFSKSDRDWRKNKMGKYKRHGWVPGKGSNKGDGKTGSSRGKKKEAEEVIRRKYHRGTDVNEREPRRKRKKSLRTTKTGRESVAPGEHLTTPESGNKYSNHLEIPPPPPPPPPAPASVGDSQRKPAVNLQPSSFCFSLCPPLKCGHDMVPHLQADGDGCERLR